MPITTSRKSNRPPRERILLSSSKRFIGKAEVMERSGVNYTTLWRWMREGKFPLPREVNGASRWLEADIDNWMSSRPVRKFKKMQSPSIAGAK